MRAVFTVVMASIALSTTNYAMAQKSVSPPDFAYPKTVSALSLIHISEPTRRP